MKTVTIETITINDEEYELVAKYGPVNDRDCITFHVRPLPKPQKTLVQVGAEAAKLTEEGYRHSFNRPCAVFDEIERRLQALEGKGK